MYGLNHLHIKTYDSFFDALEKLDGRNIRKVSVVQDTYVSICTENDEDLMYDKYTDSIVPEEEWNDIVGKEHSEYERHRLKLLENAGLKESWQAVVDYLTSHDTVTACKFNSDSENPYYFEKRELKYGCVIKGFECVENGILFRVCLFDRACNTGDVLRGMDDAYLLYDGTVKEVYLSYEADNFEKSQSKSVTCEVTVPKPKICEVAM